MLHKQMRENCLCLKIRDFDNGCYSRDIDLINFRKIGKEVVLK